MNNITHQQYKNARAILGLPRLNFAKCIEILIKGLAEEINCVDDATKLLAREQYLQYWREQFSTIFCTGETTNKH